SVRGRGLQVGASLDVRRLVFACVAETVSAGSLHGFDENPLRATERPNRLQAAFTDAVVDSAARHAEQLRGVVERYAATDTRFETGVRAVRGQCHQFPQEDAGCSAR